MLNYLYELFYSTVYSGPARNAPNAGVDIKKFIENKPPDIQTITQSDITTALQNLNKVNVVEKTTADYYSSPLIKEFNQVFSMGYEKFLEERRKKFIN